MMFIEPIPLLVFTAFIAVAIFRDKNCKVDSLLFIILLLSALNEVLSKLLRYYGYPIGTIVTLYVILTNTLWLLLLRQVSRQKKILLYAASFFLILALFNFVFCDGFRKFNHYTFTIGAFLYVCLFIYDSFEEMKRENFPYFFSGRYLVISSPVLFFIGFSFIFSFRSKKLDDTHILGTLNLYDFISYVVNAVYYIMLLYYVYQKQKIKK